MSYNDTVSSHDIQSEKMKNNKMRQLKNIKGFTLVELIVVLLIVAILAAIAVPTFLAFMDRAKEKDYETNAAKCLASTQAALSEIFSDASNSFSIKKRESVRDLCDSEKKSTEFIVWTKSALDSKSVRALPEYIASYTIEKALYEEAGCYLAYDGEKWKVFNSNKAREEALAFLSPDNDKAIYMWPYKQDLAYYPEIGEGGGSVADDSDTVRVVNLNLDTTCLNYVYYAPKGSDGNSGLKSMKVIFWKDSAGNIQSTWSRDNTTDCFQYDDGSLFELHVERCQVNGWKDSSGNTYSLSNDENDISSIAWYIYKNTVNNTKKTFTFDISLNYEGVFPVEDVYISKSAFSGLLGNAGSVVTAVAMKSLSDYENEKSVPQKAVRIDDQSVKDGFVLAWYDDNNPNTLCWWSNAQNVYMPSDCSSLLKGKTKVQNFNFTGFNFTKVTNMSEMFADNPTLQSVTGIGATGSLTNISRMYANCSSLTTSDNTNLSGNISKLDSMYEGCTSIKNIDFSSGFNTSGVDSFENMFKGCSNASDINISVFNVSSGKQFDSMFEGCSKVTSLDVTSWSLNNAVSLEATFKGCVSLSNMETDKIITTRKLKNLKETFAGCYRMTSIDLSGFNAGGVTTCEKMFSMKEWKNNTDFANNALKTITFKAGFDTYNTTNMSGMFDCCTKLTTINGLENLRTDNVTNTSYMFANTYSLTELKLTSFDTSSVTECEGMFFFDDGSSKLTKVYVSSKFIISDSKQNQKIFSSNETYNKLQGGRKTDAPTVKAIDDSGYDSAKYARADGLDGKKGYFIGDYTKAYVDKTKFQALFTTDTDSVERIATSYYTLSEIQYLDGIIDIRDTKKTSSHYVFAWRRQ